MLNTLLLSLFHFLGPVYNDAPEPWQLTFQDGANEAPNPISGGSYAPSRPCVSRAAPPLGGPPAARGAVYQEFSYITRI
jgi:hypothetical protein